MQKVLLYTDTPQIGGAELQIFLLAKFLNKKNFLPILAYSNYPNLKKWAQKFEREEIKTIPLKVKGKHDPKHFFALKKIIKEEKINLLHSHIWNPASCRYSYLAAKLTKTPLITTEHDPFKLSPIKHLIKKWLIKSAKIIVTVSQENLNKLKENFPNQAKKIKLIYNGLDTSWWKSQSLRFTENELKEIKEKTFHANQDSLIITSIAELHERKGIKYLIEAIPEVIKKFKNIKVVIIGTGKEKEKLEKLIKKLDLEKHIALIGYQKEIPKLLKASNIFVLPSIREAFGFVNLEAMISGLPIVAGKAGGIPEVVSKKNGILFEAGNSKEISRALIKLIEEPKLREQMGKAGEMRVLEKFNSIEMAKKYEEIYHKITKENHEA